MPPVTCLDLLDPTRRTILVALRRLGSATVEEVAARAFLSDGAARQHLQWLEAQGLVAHEPERRGPGRPRHRFVLTARGEALFPRVDHDALAALLAAVSEESPDLRERLIQRFTERTIRQYRPVFEREAGASPLRGIVAVFEEAGCIPELADEPRGSSLVLHHCPIAPAGRASGFICEAEQRCLAAALPGVAIRRTAFRPAGDGVCTYIFEPGDG